MNSPLWNPTPEFIKNSNIHKFKNHINNKYESTINTYSELHKWSLDNLSEFWEEIWNISDIKCSENYNNILKMNGHMIKTEWFSGAKLNFAENLLKYRTDDIAIYSYKEDYSFTSITFKDLYSKVAKLAYSLKELGVSSGDRVVGYMPNVPEAVIAMLATSSIGAIWSSCSPDFGFQGVLDRFKQIEPKIIFSCDFYLYKGKKNNCIDNFNKILNSLDSVEHSFIISYDDNKETSWETLFDNDMDEIKFEQLDFNHPLYIMYSSGTTGKPKSIVHSAGGTLIQHLKEHLLHINLKPKDKIFYYSTCGWMMWNWLVSSLSIGSSIVLYDGHPFYPENDSLLLKMDDLDIDYFGTSAKYIDALSNMNVTPKNKYEFKSLKTILSTGSPLMDIHFDYVYSSWKEDVQLSSISGGTDIISCFVLGCPILPVYKGEIQCIGLGMSIKSLDNESNYKINKKGELICDKPFPSMPIYFWNDCSNEKYLNAYFPNGSSIWNHGDFIKINKIGGVVIYGRSDATLNPGGVRIGTSEIYKIVDSIDSIIDSAAVSYFTDNGNESIILFIKLEEKKIIDNDLIMKIKFKLKNEASPRHVPYSIYQVKDIPYTINGKKVEIIIKNIINGYNITNKESLENPKCLDEYYNIII